MSVSNVLGTLHLTANNRELDFRLFEISACTLGVELKQALNSRDYLSFRTYRGRPIPLRVLNGLVNEKSHYEKHGTYRYRLLCVDPNLDLERLIRWAVPTTDLRPLQFARFRVERKFYVEVSSVQGMATQLFESVNLSRSGLLLRVSGRDSLHPDGHSVGTFLKLRLDIGRLCLPHTLEAMGRILRQSKARDERSDFDQLAVQFTSFPESHLAVWQEYTARLEREHARTIMLHAL